MANLDKLNKPKSTGRKIVSGILGIIFVVLVVCGVLVGTYVFNTPSYEGDSREIVLGKWVDKKKNVCLVFDKNGNFTMSNVKDGKEGKTLLKGYFKIDQDAKKIKVLVIPKDRDDSVDMNYKLGCFATFIYSDLEAKERNTFSKDDKDEAYCTFTVLGTENTYDCERTDAVDSLYGNAKRDERLKS